MKKFFIVLESLVVTVYLYLLGNEGINFSKYLFGGCVIGIIIFVIYKGMNKVLKNFELIIKGIEKKKNIEEKLLKPGVNKGIYYLIGMLPGNLPYGIYFGIMENGGYFRVGINSNRDIIFGKYFGGDSRNFFGTINKILFENTIMEAVGIIKDKIIKIILRVLILFALFKQGLLKINFFYFIISRIFVFCYLSLFYFLFEGSLHKLNMVLLLLLIMMEVIVIMFFSNICIYIIENRKKGYGDRFVSEFMMNYNVQLLIDPLDHRHYALAQQMFEINNSVYNVILGESVSLNILKQYMLGVNKRTEGYYLFNMNIMPRYNIKRFNEISSIPWDVLPRTRYVIMNLRYYTNGNYEQAGSYKIRELKNVYLSFFEKTYAVDSSLLSIIYLLRTNWLLNNYLISSSCDFLFENDFMKYLRDANLSAKSDMGLARLMEISKNNPELLNAFFAFNFLKESPGYHMEYGFMKTIFVDDISKKVPVIKDEKSIKKYKENMKFLSSFVLYEEEGIVGNPMIMESLKNVESLIKKNKKVCDDVLNEMFICLNAYKEQDLLIEIKLSYRDFEHVNTLFSYYGIKLNKKIELSLLLGMGLNDMVLSEIKIEEVRILNDRNFIDLSFMMVYLLSDLTIEDIKEVD